ncbi:MAG: GAF domain-containing protein [Campylobacteraceae bacterium]|nr:GAF domain-containing protein [Campylobacteraceae bacterium]
MNINNIINTEDNIIHLDNYSLDKLLEQLLFYIRNHISCDAGTIYLRENDYLRFHIFQNDTLISLDNDSKNKSKNIRLSLENNSKLIAVQAYNSSSIITVNNIYENSQYDFSKTKEFDKNFKYKSNNMLVIPLVNPETMITIGVIQLINKMKDGTYIAFTDEDTQYLKAFATLASISIIKLQNNILGMQSINNNLLELNKNLNKEILDLKVMKSTERRNFNHLQNNIQTVKSALKSIKLQKDLNINDPHLFNESYSILLSNINIIEEEISRKESQED